MNEKPFKHDLNNYRNLHEASLVVTESSHGTGVVIGIEITLEYIHLCGCIILLTRPKLRSLNDMHTKFITIYLHTELILEKTKSFDSQTFVS